MAVGLSPEAAMTPRVQSFHHASTGTWTHVASDPESRAAALVDPVLDFDPASGRVWSDHARGVLAYIGEQRLDVQWILETHAHADHLSAAQWFRTRLGAGVRVGIGVGITAVQRHFRDAFALGAGFAVDGSQFDRLFADGDRFALGALAVEVIATPGHTSDSVSYRIGDAVFVGDTLFAPNGGTARCDFPGADAATLYRSIRRLYALPDATRVFLCHDYPAAGAEPTAQTTIGAEKAGNTQLRAETSEADYVAFRHKRDATLPVPKLLYPALQVNIRAGALPQPEGGRAFLRIPLDVADA
jgi:glyoxylase-like metal-dependent hydrolase (beta-lactamase superfamily II)